MMSKNTIMAYVLLLPGLGLTLAFITIIVLMAVAQSVGYFNFAGDSKFTLHFWHEIFAKTELWRSFFYSLKVSIFSSLIAVSVAYTLALWLREPFYGSFFVSSLLKAPLLVPGLVAAFLYINFISFNGFLNQIIIHLGFASRPIRMQNDPYGIGVIILQVWKQTPYALLLLSDAVRAIGNDIIDAARDLGADSRTRLKKVILPLTLRALQACLMLIFIHAVGDYSFQAVAGPTSVNSLAQFMLRIQGTSQQGWNLSATIAILIILTSLLGALLLSFITQRIVIWGSKQ